MKIFQSAARQLAQLADDGCKHIVPCETRCTLVRNRLDELLAGCGRDAASNFVFPSLQHLRTMHHDPTVFLPPGLVPAGSGADIATLRQQAWDRIEWLPVALCGIGGNGTGGNNARFADLLTWTRDRKLRTGKDPHAAQLVLHRIEQTLFQLELTPLGNIDHITSSSSSSSSSCIDDTSQMEALDGLVEQYRLVLHEVLSSPGHQSHHVRMEVELRSRETLVTWIAFCIIHAATCKAHRVVEEYAVALRWEDLQYLVLGEKQAMDAALRVCTYLRFCSTQQRDKPPVFSMRDAGGKGTFAMAVDFARSDRTLQLLWQQEQEDASSRQQGHFEEVQRKQASAARWREHIDELEISKAKVDAAVHKASQEVTEATAARDLVVPAYKEVGDHRLRRKSAAYLAADAKVQTQLQILHRAKANAEASRQTIFQAKSSLKKAEKAPPPVYQPLPAAESSALEVLFFLHMPPLLRLLSRASFTAQQVLLPRMTCHRPSQEAGDRIDIHQYVISPQPATCWATYYNTHHSSQYHKSPLVAANGSQGKVLLLSHGAVPENVGPSHVDMCTSPSQGVWHPDDLMAHRCMGWSGGGFSLDAFSPSLDYFNPFADVPAEVMTLYYTERLPQEHRDLQWAMPQRGARTAPDRGNIAIADQAKRPYNLTKSQYLTIGALRAYPLQQLRKLCAALHDRLLPLGHPALHELVRMAVYQLGELSDTAAPMPVWRTDCTAGTLLPVMRDELDDLASELAQAPRHQAAVRLLSELASYFSAWSKPCGAVTRRFVAMLQSWRNALDEQISAATTPAAEAALHAKQCIFDMHALLCYQNLQIDAADAAAMLRFATLAHNGRALGESHMEEGQTLKLARACHNVMVTKHLELIKLLDSTALTTAVKAIFHCTPEGLVWHRLSHHRLSHYPLMNSSPTTMCYEAVTSGGHLYTCNALTGAVLFDGSPPHQLDSGILNHALYQRTFGTRNFQVTKAGDGVCRTTQPIAGRLYTFLHCEGRLAITEIDTDHGNLASDLLDGTPEGVMQWGSQLPLRLRALYSHWYCRTAGVVVFRPVHFMDHAVHYIGILDAYDPQGTCRSQILSGAGTRTSAHSAAPPSGVVRECQDGQRMPSTDHRAFISGSLACMVVPPHLTSRHWSKLLPRPAQHDGEGDVAQQSLVDKLVLHTSKVVDILSSFEPADFIHFHTQPDDGRVSSPVGAIPNLKPHVFRIELPRYNLSFVLRDGILASCNHDGYQLAVCQQLPDTLLGFQQYLVLERTKPGVTEADVKLLVPQGMVVKAGAQGASDNASGTSSVGPPPEVWIAKVGTCGDERQGCVYDVHPRFGNLQAANVSDRLQLAALYTATSCGLPEPRDGDTGRTGAEIAIELLRQCWGNRPHSQRERDQLREIAITLARPASVSAALPLLCHELACNASRLTFLPFTTPQAAEAGRERLCSSDQLSTLGAEYMRKRSAGEGSVRCWLTAEEERQILGRQSAAFSPPGRLVTPGPGRAAARRPPVHKEFIDRIESALGALVLFRGVCGSEASDAGQHTSADVTTVPEFPLHCGAHSLEP
ncbi:hypothetical protein CYMTET_43477 [Cymbomonas tetramitiformis]|uniref:Uncharacterized protein n=1 Tax=Cymbomonas tetramitiformis TaxID=36881 RepID=A0AAE0C3C7_9CHLO|nr:hypothetical protein CYMTET_43477 [Cymbomonas tetramitiformis]